MSGTLSTSSEGAVPKRLGRFAWGVLAYNLLVIAWGAFVRATGSGAGCGKHWPLCNGQVVPRPDNIKTVIELSHRITSGLAVVLVVALLVMARRALPTGHRVRRAAGFSTFFIFGEALLGGALVLFELVAHDASMKRALSMILHLGNTFLLLGALTLTAWFATAGQRVRVSSTADAGEGRALAKGAIAVALLSLLAVGASGAIAALGDTLFPPRTLREGLAQDLSPTAHLFVRLRVLHPVMALGAAAIVLATAGMLRVVRPSPRVLRLARAVAALVLVQLCAGLLNVALLAPVWMQLVHLLLADAVWISVVLLGWEAAYGAREDAAYTPIMSSIGAAPSSDMPPSTSNVEPVTYAPAGDTR
jgi:heme A synthase